MKRLKVLVIASMFAVMTIGAANSFAQTIREDAIIIELPKGINGRDGGDDRPADDLAPATEAPDDPEPHVYGVSIVYTIGH
jgi:hypothetical protein